MRGSRRTTTVSTSCLHLFAAGEDKTVDFDMTRKEYIEKMSPAERDAMEQTKKKNAEIMAKNAKIENLNALLKQARTDTAAGNYAAAIKAMTDATTAKPDEPILWDTLGDAQLGEAVAADKAAKAAKTIDPSLADKLNAAMTSYQKSLSLNAASAKPNTDLSQWPTISLGRRWAGWARRRMPTMPMTRRPRQTRRVPRSTTSTRR